MGLKCGGPRGVFVWSICITALRSGDIVANVLQLVGAARGERQCGFVADPSKWLANFT